jgi:hypothetical protein
MKKTQVKRIIVSLPSCRFRFGWCNLSNELTKTAGKAKAFSTPSFELIIDSLKVLISGVIFGYH